MNKTNIKCRCGKKIIILNDGEWKVLCICCGRTYIRFFNPITENYQIRIEEKK